MTSNINLLLYRQCYAYCEFVTKRLNLELRGFHYKVVVVHFSYLHNKFDHEIHRKSLQIWSIISD